MCRMSLNYLQREFSRSITIAAYISASVDGDPACDVQANRHKVQIHSSLSLEILTTLLFPATRVIVKHRLIVPTPRKMRLKVLKDRMTVDL